MQNALLRRVICYLPSAKFPPMQEHIDTNRAHWDDAVPAHVASEFYDVASFRSGRNTLLPVELAEVGWQRRTCSRIEPDQCKNRETQMPATIMAVLRCNSEDVSRPRGGPLRSDWRGGGESSM